MMLATAATWAICAAATAGVIARPFRWPEAIWAVTGAVLLLVFGLLAPSEALGATLHVHPVARSASPTTHDRLRLAAALQDVLASGQRSS